MHRWLLLIILVSGLILAFSQGWHEYLRYDWLKANHQQLKSWTDQNALMAVMLYCPLYTTIVAISLPGAVFATLAGGYLFGPIAAVYVVLSATVGAIIVFLAVKLSLGHWAAAKARGYLRKLEQGFNQNALQYLLVLRLIPLFPFWVINIVPALLGVSTRTYIIGTFIGITPGAFVYVMVGNGLNTVFAKDQAPNLNILFEPALLLPLLALCGLILLPILYKKIKK